MLKKNNELQLKGEDWYDHLIEECQAIATETIFRSNMELIEGKHAIGERICKEPNFKKIQGSKQAILGHVFKDIGIGRNEGYACVAFYEKYPNFSSGKENFKEGKNLSWTKIKHIYLPHKKPDGQEVDMSDCKHEDFYILKICRSCGLKEKVEESEK